MSGLTYLSPIISDSNLQKLTIALLVGGGLTYIAARSGATLAKTAEGSDELVVPESRPSFFGVVDFVLESFVKYHDSILGKENRKYVPFCGSVFFFILFANFIGLIPGMPAVTTTVWVNVGVALVVYVMFNIYGIKENGLGGYLKHLWGPIMLLGPFMFAVEFFSITLRILTLNLRLYWNITADHMVVESFTELAKVIVPSAFFMMGTFVCFMQAFVFTTLTMIYILLATQHEEEHH